MQIRRTNGPGSGLGGPRHPILRIPAEWGWVRGSHCRFGCSLEVDNFSGPVRLFLLAIRAPKVEDLGFSLERFCPVVRVLEGAYDGGNRNGRLAMQAYHSAESRALGFNRHNRSSQ